ncbi:MAG: ribonuclease P protein subunit [Candidatus ainarchaeum sp.]|nr:ribonuclease P protein subunit [Candidatus ainarchaeum sp.]
MLKGKNYEINKENISNHELIGLKLKVVNSTDKKRIGLNGMVIDETKNTLKILQGEKIVILPKIECDFEFDINELVVIKGKDILKRPEDRVKIR